MSGRHIVVDGSNIATEGRSVPSLKQLDEAVRAFVEERPDDEVVVVVDASFEHRIDQSERKLYREALDAGELLTPPAGTVGRGDKFILEVADKAKAVILSNDSFQEFQDEYEWLFEEGRLVGGKPVPGVGWIFTLRNPVRATKGRGAAKKRASKATAAKAATTKKAASTKKAPTTKKAAAARTEDTANKQRARGRRKKTAPQSKPAARPDTPAESRSRGRGSTVAPEPVNDPLPFIEFVAAHPVGVEIQGVVEQFSSHGAHVDVDGVRAYVPLKALGDPPPTRARDVLAKGERRTFVVAAFDTERRGVDLALPGTPAATAPDAAEAATARETALADQASAAAEAELTTKEATTKKAAARKSATRKKAPARKTAAKKTAARKSSAKKAPARKTAARKSAARKSAAKRAPARKKSAAKKAPAKKRATKKKAPARKSTRKR